MVCLSQTARRLAMATYSRDGAICMWPKASQQQWCNQGSVMEAQSSESRLRAAVKGV